jgi:hypothetical protein
MSEYKKLLDNIEKLQELGFNSVFNLDPYLLSIDDVAKKILKQKNPNMPIDDIDMIIDSEQISLEKMKKELDEEDKNENGNENRNNSKLTPEEKELRKEERRIRKEEKRIRKEERIKQMKVAYKEKVTELKKQAKEIRKEIKIAFYNLIEEVKTIYKKVIAAFVQAGTSIAAISIVLAAPPWNIPLAVSYTMAIVDILLTLISDLKAIIPLTFIFDQLHFVVDSKNLSILCSILNTNINIVLELWSKLNSFELLIKFLLDFIIKLLSGENKQKIFRKATRKLKKLGNFKDDNNTYNIDGNDIRANSLEDAEEAKDFIDTYKVVNKKVIDYKNDSINPEELLNQLKDQVNESPDINIPKNIENSYFPIYQVKLPNGTILRNQTEEDLEELRRIYNLVLEGIEDITTK